MHVLSADEILKSKLSAKWEEEEEIIYECKNLSFEMFKLDHCNCDLLNFTKMEW